MKRTLRLLGIIALLSTGISFTSNAQIPHITSTFFEDSCYHFVSNAVTNCTGATAMVSKIETSYADGTKDTASLYYYTYFTIHTAPYYTSGYGSERGHRYATLGTYTIKKVLL